MPAPEAGLEAPQQQQERQQRRHDERTLEGRKHQFEVGHLQRARPGADGTRHLKAEVPEHDCQGIEHHGREPGEDDHGVAEAQEAEAEQGREEDELRYLEKTIEINPYFPLSYFYKARILLNRGEKFEEAVSLVKKGIDLKPDQKDLPLGYFLLADLDNRLGNQALSQEYAKKGRARVEEQANNR